MQPRYAIRVDPESSFVTIELGGFFDPAALERLGADRAVAYRRLRCAPNRHVTLCDVSACKLQAQDLVAGFQQLIADPTTRSRKLAFVVGSSLARMQVRRMVADRADVQIFADRAEADAWLRAPEGAEAA